MGLGKWSKHEVYIFLTVLKLVYLFVCACLTLHLHTGVELAERG